MSESSELDPRGTRAALDEASHAPGAIFASPEIFRREVDEYFKREWLYVGRVEELADPGDFMALRLVGEPVLLSRDRDGELHANYNMCVHRGVEVAYGSGNLKAFSFINFDPDARPLADAMAALDEEFSLLGWELIPPLPYQGRLADPYLTPAVSAAALAADVWIDLTFPYLAGSELHDQAMEGNHIRYLLGADLNAGGLLRLFGRVDLDRYFAVYHAFDALVNDAEGKPVRITDSGGTDVSFTLGERGFSKPRRADKPGTVLVPGQCTLIPEVESVKGRIEIGAIFHEYYTSLAAPMTLEIDGRIRAISGGGNESTVADRALRRAGSGGEYGYVIHFTHGIHPAARVTGDSFIEDTRTQGNNAIGMGMPWWDPGGGENHPDAVLFMHTIDIDGQRVVEDGAIVGPESLVALTAELQPVV